MRPFGITRHTSQMIMLYMETVRRPVRTSELRQAVTKASPETITPIYGCLGDLITAGKLRRVTRERDALLQLK